MYGKLIDGLLIAAPSAITVRTENSVARIYNPQPEHYESAGYLPVIEAEYPEDGKYYELVYTERDGGIYSEWVEADAPEVEAPVPTLEQRVTDCEDGVAELSEALTMILEGAVE